MSGFSNPIIGGGGGLVYPSIHSPDFQASPLTGWSIDKNGNAYFASITLPSGATVQVYYQATAPTGTIATGSLWFNTAGGYQISRWSGSAWVAIQQDAGQVLEPGTITAALLVAGIVVAGIVDATTISAPTINGGSLTIGAAATGQVIITEDASSNGVIQFAAPSLTQYPELHSKVVLWGTLPSTDDDVLEFTYIDQAGTEHVYGYMGGAYGFQILCGLIAAPDPAHGTGPSDPAQQETWHTFTPSGGFSASTGPDGNASTPAYKRLPDGNVAMHGTVKTPSSGAVNVISFATLPAAYRPPNEDCYFPVNQNNASNRGFVVLRTNGNVQLSNYSGTNSQAVNIDGVFKLY